MKLLNREQTLTLAAAKAGMDEKTARKYRELGKLPSEVRGERSWRTREDRSAADRAKIVERLEAAPGAGGEDALRGIGAASPPERYEEGQLRTLQAGLSFSTRGRTQRVVELDLD